MPSRERRDIRRERSTGTATAPDEVDGEEPDGDLTVDQTPASSLDDLTTPAEPGNFTQTFTDDDALLDITGGFDPTAGAKQVIPRVAYTINFNFVWDADQQVWVPKKKGDEPGTGNVIDSFEDGDISEYSGDTGAFTVDATAPVFDGDQSLKCSSNNQTITSLARLENYPERGDTIQFHVYLVGSDSAGEMDIGAGAIDSGQYELVVNHAQQSIRLQKADQSGTIVTINVTNAPVPSDVWLRARASWGAQTITLEVFRTDTGRSIGTVQLSDTQYNSGAIGFSTSPSVGSNTSVTWDLAEIVET